MASLNLFPQLSHGAQSSPMIQRLSSPWFWSFSLFSKRYKLYKMSKYKAAAVLVRNATGMLLNVAPLDLRISHALMLESLWLRSSFILFQLSNLSQSPAFTTHGQSEFPSCSDGVVPLPRKSIMMAGLSILKRFCQSDGEVALICTFVEEYSSIRERHQKFIRSTIELRRISELAAPEVPGAMPRKCQVKSAVKRPLPTGPFDSGVQHICRTDNRDEIPWYLYSYKSPRYIPAKFACTHEVDLLPLLIWYSVTYGLSIFQGRYIIEYIQYNNTHALEPFIGSCT